MIIDMLSFNGEVYMTLNSKTHIYTAYDADMCYESDEMSDVYYYFKAMVKIHVDAWIAYMQIEEEDDDAA